jgi:D-glycerate 3-kinase
VTTRTDPAHTPQWQIGFLQRHQLDIAYLETAQEWFAPLASALAKQQNSVNRPLLVALNGSQGSGKTTVSDYLCASLIEEHRLRAIALSLDDFYLTHAERQALAASVHPLLATRGVPGTHDMVLLRQTLEQLLQAYSPEPVAIPRFDKAADDRRPISEWDRIAAPVQLVLLEGWCLGAEPEPNNLLFRPLNDLERDEDPAGLWREYSNEILRREFQSLYSLVDQWIMLCAPSFDCVFEWRREQECKLAATLLSEQAGKLMDDDALRRFIQHFERITRSCLKELPHKVNHLFSLDKQRQIKAYSHLNANY